MRVERMHICVYFCSFLDFDMLNDVADAAEDMDAEWIT